MSDKVKSALNYILGRLGENSTYRGLFMFFGGVGLAIPDATAQKVTAACMMIVGAINVFREGAPTKSQVAEALSTKQDKQ